ncbi:ubiE/COQ5 methyltransferase family protein (plasmid) [Agrobacterium sp. RAC06]|nr:ubiE/COQ5 methyltransferase family protein [Agrobacterium sp. RAC06]
MQGPKIKAENNVGAIVNFDEQFIRSAYEKISAQGAEIRDVPDNFVTLSAWFHKEQLWRDYLDLFKMVPSLKGCKVVDFGCKFGHTFPIFHALGAAAVIGVDVEDEYLRVGNLVFSAIGFPCELVKSDEGYLPIESETVDFVLVNEVISHINPTYLDTVYAEIARILKVGGKVLISDGNNRASESCVADLRSLYAAWENGPAGTSTGRDTVDEPFRGARRDIIAGLHPDMKPEEIDYLADNTSGLFGERLAIEVGKYIRREGWVARPYRDGCCPTNPGAGGVVMERALHPVQVELGLAEHGIAAQQLFSYATTQQKSLRYTLAVAVYNLRLRMTKMFAPHKLYGRTWALYVLGTKVGTPPADWDVRKGVKLFHPPTVVNVAAQQA